MLRFIFCDAFPAVLRVNNVNVKIMRLFSFFDILICTYSAQYNI